MYSLVQQNYKYDISDVYVVIHSSTPFYFQAYISNISNECSNNLSTEEDGDYTKFQKLDVQSNKQLTLTSVLKENKRAYSGTTIKQ